MNDIFMRTIACPSISRFKMRRRKKPMSRSAFTLVELLVVIAIISVLVGLLAPSVQAMRESSRRSNCQIRLMGIGIANQGYHDRWQHFPVGTIADKGPIFSVATNDVTASHHNWIGRLMDFMDQPVIAGKIDRTVSVYDPVNAPVLGLMVPDFKCPSGPVEIVNASDYAGLHHPSEKQIDESDLGVFVLNTTVSRDDVSDGLSNTAIVAEKITFLGDLGWLSGTRATLRNVGGGIASNHNGSEPTDPKIVGSIGSFHPAGTHVLFGNGEVRFQTLQTDERILQQMVDRRDGGIPRHLQSIEQLRRESVGLPADAAVKP
jgi:prepilin-type N-terminal cleavage/methylation domain-containing protein